MTERKDPFEWIRKYAERWTDKDLLEIADAFRSRYEPNWLYIPPFIKTDDLVPISLAYYDQARAWGMEVDALPKLTGDRKRDSFEYRKYYLRVFNKLSHFVGGDFRDYCLIELAFAFRSRFGK